MSHQIRNVVICGFVVLILLGAWLAVSLLPQENASGTSSQGEVLSLIERDTADLTSLTIQNAEGTLSFSLNDEGVLLLEGCEDLPRYDTRYTALLPPVQSASRQRISENLVWMRQPLLLPLSSRTARKQ